MPTVAPRTAVSAPGKVLLAGGYLALDRAYTGLVFGLSARINAVAQDIETSAGVQLSEIVVASPQFLEAEWRYGYHLAPEDGGIKVTQLMVGSTMKPNPFVETTLSYALTYITAAATAQKLPSHSLAPARFTVLADNAYYSQPASSSAAADTHNPTRFARFGTTLGDAHKTGLGSSAAIVTSLTAALLSHYLPPSSNFDLSSPPDSVAGSRARRILHNLAQAAHCAAQGKVGSGFDVAAAVYGSCRYRRFSPSILTSLPESGSPGFAPALLRCVDDLSSSEATTETKEKPIWDTEIISDSASDGSNAPTLPPGIALRMCDVDCGSQTVGMVKQVLAWRAANPARAEQLWDDLQVKNETLAGVLATSPTSEVQIERAVSAIRDLVRAMGVESGCPIEPESQTALLDALSIEVDGVINGVVPGAGGFDALALLVRDDAETEAAIQGFLERWSGEGRGRVRLLDVKGQMEGVRIESGDFGQYEGWLG